MLLVDPLGEIIDVNEMHTVFINQTRDELIGQHIRVPLYPSTRAMRDNPLNQLSELCVDRNKGWWMICLFSLYFEGFRLRCMVLVS